MSPSASGKASAVLDSTSRTGAGRRPDPAAPRRPRRGAVRRTAAELGAELIAALHEALAADQVHLFEVAQDRAERRGHDLGPGAETTPWRSTASPSGVARVVATGATLHVPDARGSGVIRAELVERYDVASALFVPVAHDGEVRRVAIMLSHAPREFTPDEIADAETLAQVAAAGLARLEAEHRRDGPRRPRPRAGARRAARSTCRSSCTRCCARSRARPRSPSAPTSPASTSATRATAASPPPATTWRDELARHRARRPARARPAQVLLTGQTFVDQRLPARRRRGRSPRCAASAPRSRSRWSGTTSSRARCRSAGRRCAGSRRRTAARWRRSPTSPPSPATTPRPTTTCSRPRAPTR